MLIDIDLDEAKRLKLTINQFLLIKLILENVNIESYQNVIHINDSDVEVLIKLNIFTKESVYDDKLKNLYITDDFKGQFKTRNFFDEFYDLYPVYSIRTDGQKDYLRADVNRCRKMYNGLVGKSKSKHERMLDSLKFEITNRRINNSMAYMKRMYKWLYSAEYLTYEESLLESASTHKKIEAYGTDVV